MASEIGVQTIQHTNGTDAMTIDSSGRVSQPQKPSWRLGVASAQTLTATANNDILFNTAESGYGFLRGGCTVTSGGVLSVPVAGVYQVTAKVRSGSTSYGNATSFKLMKNGSIYSRVYVSVDPHSSYSDIPVLTCLIELTTSDTIKVQIYPSNAANVNTLSDGVCWFEGYLVA